jgi:hypothetical protein
MLSYFSRLAVVLVEIADGKHNIDQEARNRLDSLVTDMAAEGAKVDALQIEVTGDETKEASDVLSLGDRMTNAEARLTDLDGKETVLEAKVADVETAELNINEGLSNLTDTLEAAAGGGNTALGGQGDDSINASGSETSTVLGGQGDETLLGGQGADSINTGGTDSIVAAAGGDTALGGQGNDVIEAAPIEPAPEPVVEEPVAAAEPVVEAAAEEPAPADTGSAAPEAATGPVLGDTVTATPDTPTAATIAADDPSLVVSAPGEPLAVVTDDPAIVAQTVTDTSTHDSVIVTDHPDGSQLVTPVLSIADNIAVGDVVVDPATATPTAAPVEPAA